MGFVIKIYQSGNIRVKLNLTRGDSRTGEANLPSAI